MIAMCIAEPPKLVRSKTVFFYSFFQKITRCFLAYFGLNVCFKTKCVDAPPKPALKTVYPPDLLPPPLLRLCLQNLVQHFKIAYAFSV